MGSILLTGTSGCIRAWAVRHFLEEEPEPIRVDLAAVEGSGFLRNPANSEKEGA